MGGLLLSLLLAAGGVAVVLRQAASGPSDPDAPRGSQRPGDAGRAPSRRDAAAAALLDRLAHDLRSGAAGRVTGAAAPGQPRAARELRTLLHNVRTLRVRGLALRYLGDVTARLGARQRQALVRGGWVGDVELRWRLHGYDSRSSELVLPVTFRTSGASTSFLTARGGYGTVVPLWLLSRVQVARTPRSLVVVTSAGPSTRRRASAVAALADQAVLDVRRVLGRWRGRLVVEVPPDRAALARVLGGRPGDYRGIAAVTSTPDGSSDAGAPEHVFLDPPVFGSLGARGAQIVLSHEATHVATAAAVSPLPTWLVEGFADYVALRDVDLPVRVAAGQVLARVRRDGPPDRLPAASDFEAHTPALGASYESAWLACRLIARRYGERRLVELYRTAERTSSTTTAFRRVLGTGERAFTRAWRADLRRLAG